MEQNQQGGEFLIKARLIPVVAAATSCTPSVKVLRVLVLCRNCGRTSNTIMKLVKRMKLIKLCR